MIYVYIDYKMKNFETDIRDLCMAFFLYKKITYIYEDVDIAVDENDIVIKNFYDGEFSSERFVTKNRIKRSLYRYLSKITNKKLPYGALTGIRPVSIVTQIYEYLYDGVDTDSDTLKSFIKYYKSSNIFFDLENKKTSDSEVDLYIKKYLESEYLVSDEKIELLIYLAKNEISLLKSSQYKNYKNEISIYIGVPFCKSTCLYCSFTSFNIDKWGNYVKDYLIALDKELYQRNNEYKNKTITSLYIGGGTPTSLSLIEFDEFLNVISKHINLSELKEFTVEAGRPDTIDKDKLEIMKKYGVSRISINPQTFNQKTLDIIGRKHTVYEITEKFYLARCLGFDNINMDIILGLPNEGIDEVEKTTSELKKLKPDSITVHSLYLKRAARLNSEKEEWRKTIKGINDFDIYEIYDLVFKTMSDLKEEPYYLYRQKNMVGNLENIGYALKGKESIYNIMMMEERQSIYGYGCGASSKIVEYIGDKKIVNRKEGYKSIIDYLKSEGVIS